MGQQFKITRNMETSPCGGKYYLCENFEGFPAFWTVFTNSMNISAFSLEIFLVRMFGKDCSHEAYEIRQHLLNRVPLGESTYITVDAFYEVIKDTLADHSVEDSCENLLD